MTVTQDLIYAARSLRKAPGLVVVVVLTVRRATRVDPIAALRYE